VISITHIKFIYLFQLVVDWQAAIGTGQFCGKSIWLYAIQIQNISLNWQIDPVHISIPESPLCHSSACMAHGDHRYPGRRFSTQPSLRAAILLLRNKRRFKDIFKSVELWLRTFCESDDVLFGVALSTDSPISAFNFFYNNSSYRTQVFAFDGDHGVIETSEIKPVF